MERTFTETVNYNEIYGACNEVVEEVMDGLMDEYDAIPQEYYDAIDRQVFIDRLPTVAPIVVYDGDDLFPKLADWCFGKLESVLVEWECEADEGGMPTRGWTGEELKQALRGMICMDVVRREFCKYCFACAKTDAQRERFKWAMES